MSESSEGNGTAPKPTVEELRAEIRQTRADLGETVQALAAKADVKARAKEQVEQTKVRVKAQAVEAAGRVREAVRSATTPVPADGLVIKDDEFAVRRSPMPLSLVVAGVAALVGVILIVRGSRR